MSKYGTRQLVLKQHTFNRHVSREEVTYWRCSQFAVLRCRARIKTKGNTLTVLNSEHNHEVITKARKYGSLKAAAAAAAAMSSNNTTPVAGKVNLTTTGDTITYSKGTYTLTSGRTETNISD